MFKSLATCSRMQSLLHISWPSDISVRDPIGFDSKLIAYQPENTHACQRKSSLAKEIKILQNVRGIWGQTKPREDKEWKSGIRSVTVNCIWV